VEGFKVKPANIRIFYKTILLSGLFGILCILCSGCQEEKLSSSSEVTAFELAGPIIPKVDLEQLLRAKSNFGIYTVGQDDVLEIQMPTILTLTVVSPKNYNDRQQQVEPYLCRVSNAGMITVPILGQMNAQGKTLAQVEEELVSGYYPKYVLDRPSVVCSVKEYHFRNVTVVGAVAQPGVFQLKSNEMSLVTALMKAGGIVESGASVITIKNPQRQSISAKSADDIKQLAELADSSRLEVELAFQPEKSSPTRGNLVIQKDSKVLYTKKIDINNSFQRAEYIKDLKPIIGDRQAKIAGQALEQLASQLSPAIAASGEKHLDSDEKELIETAAEDHQTSPENNSAETSKKENGPGGDKKYIETPMDDKAEVGTSKNGKGIEFVEPTPMEGNQPASSAAPVVKPIILPVKGLNIPFVDMPLLDGDLIEVKRLTPSVFTVIGLAQKPGAFPYPPDIEYNLMQAIGFAGGLDQIADPRFVTVYRQNAKGDIVSATFRVDKKFMASSCNVKIKPGDVISIDMTSRTRRNIVLNQIFRINMGLYANPFGNN
jgi:protein involved in polysaccharide export with SLBB domain